ncbi:MAG: glycosyltransferase [Chloroflexota bacterium]|nr:glycosyltransferase [Chloroflexota bacterium]
MWNSTWRINWTARLMPLMSVVAGALLNIFFLYNIQWAGLHELGLSIIIASLVVLILTSIFAPWAVHGKRRSRAVRLGMLIGSQVALLGLLTTPSTLLGVWGIALLVIATQLVYLVLLRMPMSQRIKLPRGKEMGVQTRRIALAMGVLILDMILLINFNTLQWPYLWPQPMLYLILFLMIVLIIMPRRRYDIWLIRLVGVAMVFIGQCYLLHTLQVTIDSFDGSPALIGLNLLHLLGFASTYLVFTLSFINQIAPREKRGAQPLPDVLPHVAAVIPTYGEPVEVVEQTVISLTKLDYPADHLTIVISDDGHRPEMQKLAARYGVGYNFGAKKDAKAGNLNSALKYLQEHAPQAELILTQDADEVIHSTFLKRTVGFFSDPEIAFVQTPKDAAAPEGDPFGTRDRIFYDIYQPGRNGYGAAFACGSGVIWRISAVQSIGGFVTWNVVEDLTTSYFLHAAGYKSEYLNEVLSIGLAPDDIPGLLKQRGTWAVDTWRLFLFDNPLLKKGLTLKQRAQYLEITLFYAMSAIFTPLLMIVPMISLMTGIYVPIEGSALFPWMVASALYYVVIARGRIAALLRMWQYWIGHGPTYFSALRIALRSRTKKPSYKVTRKTRVDGYYGYLLWMQFVYILLGIIALVNAFVFRTGDDLGTRVTNAFILLFFMYMMSGIIRASFYGWKPFRDLRARLMRATRSREEAPAFNAAGGGD